MQQPVAIELLNLSSTIMTLLNGSGELRLIHYVAPHFQQNNIVSKLLLDLKSKKGKSQKISNQQEVQMDAFAKHGPLQPSVADLFGKRSFTLY